MLPLFFLLQTRPQDNELLFVSDKIYAVLAVILIIFGGFITYLFLTQRRIKRLEDQMDRGQ
ncbi:MAG: CcmD family protein [Bacteroidota bacterium]